MSLEADKSATEAEVKHNFTLLTKSKLSEGKFVKVKKMRKFSDQVRVLQKKLKFTA